MPLATHSRGTASRFSSYEGAGCYALRELAGHIGINQVIGRRSR